MSSPQRRLVDSQGRLDEYYVQDAFHSYLKSSLAQAKAEHLLDVEVLSGAEGDLMITGAFRPSPPTCIQTECPHKVLPCASILLPCAPQPTHLPSLFLARKSLPRDTTSPSPTVPNPSSPSSDSGPNASPPSRTSTRSTSTTSRASSAASNPSPSPFFPSWDA